MSANEKFKEYFYEIESYGTRAERFYDANAIRDEKSRSVQMTQWLEAAFHAGYNAAIKDLKEKQNSCYTDIVSDGGMDPRDRDVKYPKLQPRKFPEDQE